MKRFYVMDFFKQFVDAKGYAALKRRVIGKAEAGTVKEESHLRKNGQIRKTYQGANGHLKETDYGGYAEILVYALDGDAYESNFFYYVYDEEAVLEHEDGCEIEAGSRVGELIRRMAAA